jgi:type I pantothenate kinase
VISGTQRRRTAGIFLEYDRAAWAGLRDRTPLPFTAEELDRWRSQTDVIDLDEVRAIYLPLARLLTLHIAATARLRGAIADFTDGIGDVPAPVPYVIGVAGSVAAGKSTLARTLRALLARTPAHPRVELVTTDGFLHPNAELERRGLLARKGFPESYDRRALLRFVSEVKAGRAEVAAPVYSHLSYDIVPGEHIVVRRPDVLILEGLNLLQPAVTRADGRPGLSVVDFVDFSIYLDARRDDLRSWYVDRFLAFRKTAFADPRSYFHRYAELTDEQARTRASEIWQAINEPNLVDNILPTRARARLVLVKGPDHRVSQLRLRRV